MSKIFICGIVSSEEKSEVVKRYVEQCKFFDGTVFAVNYPTDDYSSTEVYGLLSNNKGQGRIMKAPWQNQHSAARNLYLNSSCFKEGDWLFTPDIQEIFKPDFLANIRSLVSDWEQQGINGTIWGRLYGFRWSEELRYEGNPHERLLNFNGHVADMRDESKVKYFDDGVIFGDLLTNYKSFDNSMLLSAVKYWLSYSTSNESLNQFGKYGADVVREYEIKRRELRKYLQETLNINVFNIKDIVSYLKNTVDYPQKLKDYIENDDQLKNLYRFYILNQDRATILANRYNYSVWGTPNYIGERNKLNLKLGLPQE